MSIIDSINFRENKLIFSGIWGEAELILGIWGAKEKYFQGAEVLFFQGVGEINALFSGIKGAQTPPWVASHMLLVNKIISMVKSLRNVYIQIFNVNLFKQTLIDYFVCFVNPIMYLYIQNFCFLQKSFFPENNGMALCLTPHTSS